MIQDESGNAKGRNREVMNGGAELFYVSASGPVAVTVVDTLGNATGPSSLEDYRVIEYGLPQVSYYPSETNAVVSMQYGSAYTLSIESPVENINVRVFRMIVDEPDEVRTTILFDDQELDPNGVLEIALDASGTPTDTHFRLDFDGDGDFEGTLEPVDETNWKCWLSCRPNARSNYDFRKDGWRVSRTSLHRHSRCRSNGWTWTLTEDAEWITPVATSGNAPATITLDVAANMISDTLATSDLEVELSYGDYVVNSTIPIEVRIGSFTVNNEAAEFIVPAEFDLSNGYPNPFSDGVSFNLAMPIDGFAQVEVFDILGRRVSTLNSSHLPAGTHTLKLDGGSLPNGIYLVRAVFGHKVVTRSVVQAK